MTRVAVAAVTMVVASVPQVASAQPLRIVVLGDSLSAGYGLPAGATFPAKLEKALQAKGIAVEITNAGVSGDTASDGLARVDWSVPDGTDAVILELGANDALRGLDPAITRGALEKIVQRLKARNIAVFLCGMLAPRNLGPDYTRRFDAIFPDLAKAYGLPRYPFFLDGVAANANLNQRDGIHPTAAGIDQIVSRILPLVEEFIAKIRADRRP